MNDSTLLALVRTLRALPEERAMFWLDLCVNDGDLSNLYNHALEEAWKSMEQEMAEFYAARPWLKKGRAS